MPALLWTIWEWVATAVILIKRQKSLISLSVVKSLFFCPPELKNCTGKVVTAKGQGTL